MKTPTVEPNGVRMLEIPFSELERPEVLVEPWARLPVVFPGFAEPPDVVELAASSSV